MLDPAGKEQKGTLQAENRDTAAASLREGGRTLVSLTEAGALSKNVQIGIFSKKPKARDLAVFCRQFVSIITAGVPVIEALSMLAEQTENKKLAAAADDCRMSLEKGSSLADAMRAHRDVFSDLFITMVAAGEASGSLDVSFSRMATQFEKDAKLRGSVKKASVYPIIVCIVTVAVIAVLMVFVIPNFESMFSDLGSDLPGITKAVIAVSKYVQHRWYVILGAILLLVFAVKYIKKTGAGAHFFGRLGIKAPLFGRLTIKTASARMSRTLATLLAAGIPLMDAIDITSDTMDNIFFREALKKAKDDVAVGTPLSETLERSQQFPPLVYHMLKIGEETGNIDGMLVRLADYYDEEVETATEQLMAALEPMIIILLAAIVGVVVMAVMLPMANMYSALDNL